MRHIFDSTEIIIEHLCWNQHVCVLQRGWLTDLMGSLFYRWPLCLQHKFKVLPGIYLCYVCVCFLSPWFYVLFSPCPLVFFFYTTKILLHTATAAAACWWDRRSRTMTSFKRRPPKRLDDCTRTHPARWPTSGIAVGLYQHARLLRAVQ